MCLSLLAGIPQAIAEPYKPTQRDSVLLELKAPLEREFAQLRSQVDEQSLSQTAARELAQKYLMRARQQADPRYLGYAEAAIAPWLDTSPAPIDILVLQATILQSRHEFPRAVAILRDVLEREPGHHQALLTLATIYQVQGHLEKATRTCRQLLAARPDIVGMTCLANAQSLRGELQPSYRTLTAAVDTQRRLKPAVLSWVQTSLAEMALRLGRDDAAEGHFQRALSATPGDAYLLSAYSDFLLTTRRPEAVLELLQGREQQDGHLLRMILAGMAAGHPDTRRWAAMLSARFEAVEQRGDAGHLRERARFALDVQKKPALAVELAQRNWQSQREPADLLLLLRAARTASAAEPRQAAIQWVEQTGYEDVRITTYQASP